MRAAIYWTLPLLIVVACSRSDVPTANPAPQPPTQQPSAPAVVLSINKNIDDNGDLQSGEVGTDLAKPLRVQVLSKDANGVTSPAAGIAVVWFLPGAAGHVFTATDAAGVAAVSFKLGTIAGEFSVLAAPASNQSARTSLSVRVRAGVAATLEKISGDSQTVASSYPAVSELFLVRGLDRFGNIANTNSAVQWSVASGPIEIRSFSTQPVEQRSWADIRTLGMTGTGHVRANIAATGASVDFVVTLSGSLYDVSIDDPTGSDTLAVFLSARNGSEPAIDTVPVGSIVRWTNRMYLEGYAKPGARHQVISIGSPSFANTTVIPVSGSTSVVFDTPGIYQYGDAFSPRPRGTIVVIPK